jgi:hypothetical protein
MEKEGSFFGVWWFSEGEIKVVRGFDLNEGFPKVWVEPEAKVNLSKLLRKMEIFQFKELALEVLKL